MKIIIYLLSLLISTAYGYDLTETYHRHLSSTKSSINKLKNYKILIIPGVLAESFLSNGNNALKFNLVFDEGFKDQIKFLKDNHLNYEFVNLETENSPEVNSKIIIQKIIDSDRPVLIYSHSKGGLDMLEAINERPDLLDKIKGWASVQTPFWGSPIASEINDYYGLRIAAKKMFELMGGNKKGLNSLTVDDRLSYMSSERIKSLIPLIKSKVRFINYASTKNNKFGYDTSLEFFRNYCDKISGPNDGVVPLSSALMAKHGFDIDYVIEENVDHLMTMTKFYVLKLSYDRKRHLQTILDLVSE